MVQLCICIMFGVSLLCISEQKLNDFSVVTVTVVVSQEESQVESQWVDPFLCCKLCEFCHLLTDTNNRRKTVCLRHTALGYTLLKFLYLTLMNMTKQHLVNSLLHHHNTTVNTL